MNEEEKLAIEIYDRAQELAVEVVEKVHKAPAQQQMAIAALLIAKLFGSAYMTTFRTVGSVAARLWAEELLGSAEEAIARLGGQVRFTITVKEG